MLSYCRLARDSVVVPYVVALLKKRFGLNIEVRNASETAALRFTIRPKFEAVSLSCDSDTNIHSCSVHVSSPL